MGKTQKKQKKTLYVYLPKKNNDVTEVNHINDSIDMVKDLGNEPANILNPDSFIEFIKKRGKQTGFKVEILDEPKLKSLKMNSLISVAQGSKHNAKMAIITYKNSNAKPTVIVGKGITFDTGGNSLKGSRGMYEMKTDMLGAATTLGIIDLVTKLKLKKHVIGLLPIAENMPGRHATRPGDIVKSMSGKTIEIMNTDAEGRLIMADALTYAHRYKPNLIIDIATLTGQQRSVSCGLFTTIMGNDEKIIDKFRHSGDKTDDRVWPMPLYPEFIEYTRSDVADIKNAEYSCRSSTILAGAFLSHFISNQKWIHLDIAGPSYIEKSIGYYKKGTTGAGLRLVLDYIKNN